MKIIIMSVSALVAQGSGWVFVGATALNFLWLLVKNAPLFPWWWLAVIGAVFVLAVASTLISFFWYVNDN